VDAASGQYVTARILGCVLVAGPMNLPHDGLSAEDKARCGEVVRLHVCPSTVGTGVAQQLLDRGLAWLLAKFPGDVYLRMWSQNYRAQSFYSKYGCRLAAEYKCQVGGKQHDERVYVLPRTCILACFAAKNACSFKEETNSGIEDDMESVEAAEAALRTFERSKLRPLLEDLVALKGEGGVFCEDYAAMEARLCGQGQGQGQREGVSRDFSGAGAEPRESPHRELFLEHLAMFCSAILLSTRVTELRGQWSETAQLQLKVIEYMTYSGRFSEHVGVSGYDVELRARTRRAINALCAPPTDVPGFHALGPFFDAPSLSDVGNMDICKVRAKCAQALFSAGRFDEAKALAEQAVQGLALSCLGTRAGYSSGSRGSMPESVFWRSHMAVPSVHEVLCGQPCVLYSGGADPAPYFESYAAAFQQALSLVLYSSKADLTAQRQKQHQ